MSEPRSLFEQWKAGHTALTFESWLVKHIKELENHKTVLEVETKCLQTASRNWKVR
jgi:hypothetical protein